MASGGNSAAGLRLYGGTNGDSGFSNSPSGGRGCKVNPWDIGARGNHHWSGTPRIYMQNSNYDTYIYFCNGAQHSSSTCDT